MNIGQTVTRDFTTTNPMTGQVQDADVLPTCEVFEDATDAAILTPVVTKRAGHIGNYRVTFDATTGNGFEVGKSYNVVVKATVAGTTAKAPLVSFIVTEPNASTVVIPL